MDGSLDLDAPKQKNGHDCGVYVLQYAVPFIKVGRMNHTSSLP